MILFFLVLLSVGVGGDSFSCVNCMVYNRLGREKDNCAKSFEECGGCLEGYEEVGITKGTRRLKPCKKSKKKDGCDSDENCGENHYCFHRHCVPCFNCLNLNRVVKSRCAKAPIECGPCLTGFEDELPKTRDAGKCKQGTYAAYFSQNERSETTAAATVGTVSVISVTFLAVVIFAAFIYVIVKKKIIVNRDEEDVPVEEEIPVREMPVTRCPPPSYSEANEFSSCEEFTTFVTESKELVNEAIVFRNPTAPYYPSSSHIEEEANETEMEEEAANEIQPEDDEATIPSSWTPNASGGLFPSSNASEAEVNTPVDASSNRENNLDESQTSAQSSNDSNNTQDSSEIRETRC